MSSDDYGKDLPGVEQLLRRHDEIEQDMSAIHQKLNEHDEEAKKLLTVESPLKSKIFESLQKLEVVWRELADLANERRNKLHQSLALHRYFDSVKKMEQWASDLRVKITSYIHPRSIADCQRLLKFHKERLVEIEARDHDLKGIRERGQKRKI